MHGDYSGRISRKVYFKATLFVLTLQLFLLLGYSMVGLRQPIPTFLLGIAILGLFLYHFTLIAGRLHDLGRPGQWAWFIFVPFLNLYLHTVLLFKKGDAEENDFGLAPLDEGTEYTLPLIISFMLLATTIGLKSMNTSPTNPAKVPPPSYTMSEVALQGRLQETPCHAQSAYDLSQSYLRTHHFQDAIDLEKTYHARCKKHVVQLNWTAFEAAKELENFELAEHIVGQLIADYPEDPDYLGWRGMLYENQRNLEKAAKDFEAVIRLKPKIRGIPLNLRDVYRELDQPCQALAVQNRYAEIYPDVGADKGIRQLKAKLQKECRVVPQPEKQARR